MLGPSRLDILFSTLLILHLSGLVSAATFTSDIFPLRYPSTSGLGMLRFLEVSLMFSAHVVGPMATIDGHDILHLHKSQWH